MKPPPSDVVQVKLHPTFTGSIEDALALLTAGSGAQFVKQDSTWLLARRIKRKRDRRARWAYGAQAT